MQDIAEAQLDLLQAALELPVPLRRQRGEQIVSTKDLRDIGDDDSWLTTRQLRKWTDGRRRQKTEENPGVESQLLDIEPQYTLALVPAGD